jgi:cyclic dehypoxanthinyl futalosine synthase
MGISREQALDCFRSDDLVGIGMEADAVRRRLHPEGVVSYVVDRRIDCAGALDGTSDFAGALERICAEIAETIDLGGSGVRLASGDRGMDRERFDKFESMLRAIRLRFSTPWIEGPAATEIAAMAASCGSTPQETLARLRDAGLDSIAADGVNLLREASVAQWLEVHRAAHALGMRTAAAMIFGAGETMEQRVEFLDAVRRLQQETGGFSAFLPVAADTSGGRELDGVTAVERLKTLAISRMFLDNIENVQASSEGSRLKVLQMGLRFGGNDAGSATLAGDGGSEEDLRRIIRDAGFMPAQRDPVYRTMMLG